MNDQKDRFRSGRKRQGSNQQGSGSQQRPPQNRSNDNRQDLRWGQQERGGQGGFQNAGRNHRQGQNRQNPNEYRFGSGGRNPNQQGGQGGGHNRRHRSNRDNRDNRGPGPVQSIRNANGRLDMFELFCAYHLGITADGRYRQQNLHDLARRFGITPAELKQALVDYHMDPQTLINSDFDLALAQLDMQVAPEGVDRRELAKQWFEEFLNARPNARDWLSEIEADAKENEKIFGDK